MRTLQEKNAFIHEMKRFMTVLGELPFSLLYWSAINIYVSGRRLKRMKHLLKGAAAVVIMMIVSIIVNVLCNRYDMELNTTATNMVWMICALAIYHGLIRNEK